MEFCSVQIFLTVMASIYIWLLMGNIAKAMEKAFCSKSWHSKETSQLICAANLVLLQYEFDWTWTWIIFLNKFQPFKTWPHRAVRQTKKIVGNSRQNFLGVSNYSPGTGLQGLQSWTKYMRQTLVFIWNSAIQENFNFYSSAVFCYYQKTFSLGGRLGTRL